MCSSPPVTHCRWVGGCPARVGHARGGVAAAGFGIAPAWLGFVATENEVTPIAVPTDECNVMASPTAVAGRFPNGALMKKNDSRLANLTTQLVPPLPLGHRLLGTLPRNASISVVKIDTEVPDVD